MKGRCAVCGQVALRDKPDNWRTINLGRTSVCGKRCAVKWYQQNDDNETAERLIALWHLTRKRNQ